MIWLFILVCAFSAVVSNRNTGSIPWSVKPGIILDGLPVFCIVFFFLLVLVLTQRLFLSLITALGGSFLIWLVNRIKQDLFHEPLTFMDFFLIPQVFKHPRFYLPYLAPARVMLPIIVSLGGLVVLFFLEKPISEQMLMQARLVFAALVPVLVLQIFMFSGPGKSPALKLLNKNPVQPEPEADISRYGLMGLLFLQGLWHRHKRHEPGCPGIPEEFDRAPACLAWEDTSLDPMPAEKAPHIILIQAESFFDLRGLDPAIDPGMLKNLDQLSRHCLSGRIMVSSHGAYTMRTEFAVLSGMDPQQLGTDSLNPYLEAAGRPVWSMARHLKKSGYTSLFIHPFDPYFFRRDLVMPNLGFEKIIHEGNFMDPERFGPYISDMALAREILSQVRNSGCPRFIFAVTMEAHGPWDQKRLNQLPPGPRPAMPSWGGAQLEIYIRHLINTDAMLGFLAKELEGLGRPFILCLYGDHPGSLPAVYARTGRVQDHTPYIVWPGKNKGIKARKDIRPQDLGSHVLGQALSMAGHKGID